MSNGRRTIGWRSFHTLDCGCELWSSGDTFSREEPSWGLNIVCRKDRARRKKTERNSLHSLSRPQMQQLRGGMLTVAQVLKDMVVPMRVRFPLVRLTRAVDAYKASPSRGTKSWVTKKRKEFDQAASEMQGLLADLEQLESGVRKMTKQEFEVWSSDFYRATWVHPQYANTLFIPEAPTL